MGRDGKGDTAQFDFQGSVVIQPISVKIVLALCGANGAYCSSVIKVFSVHIPLQAPYLKVRILGNVQFSDKDKHFPFTVSWIFIEVGFWEEKKSLGFLLLGYYFC